MKINIMIPVLNEEGTGYILVRVTIQAKPIVEMSEESFQVIYRPTMQEAGIVNSALFADGALDNEIKFRINILCMKDGEIAETVGFVFSDELVQRVYPEGSIMAFQLTVRGATTSFDEYKIEFVIEAAGQSAFSQIWDQSFIPTPGATE